MAYIYRTLVVLCMASVAFAQQSPSPANPTSTASTPATQPKVDRAASYYHYALAHMYEEQVAMYGNSELATKAIDEYRKAIEADPNTHEAHKLLGRIYLRSLGDAQDGSAGASSDSQNVLKLAIEQYEEIIKLEPDSVENHLLLGRLYRLNNDLLKAENEFKTAVKIDPSSEDAATTLALLYTEENDSARAAQVLSSVPDASRSAKLYSVLGYTFEQQKQYKKAIDAYRKAVELDHDNLDAVRGLAQNLMNDGQTDAALEQYKIIADANPEDAQTYLRMAEIYRRNGKFDLAIDNLTKAQSMVQESLEVPYALAAVYQTQGKYDDAARTLQELLKKTEKPDGNYSQDDKNRRAVFLERLGSVYRDQNNIQLALETFRKMLPLGDENASRGYQEIIETYRQAKDWQQATDAAHEATQKLPNDRDLKMAYAGQLAEMGKTDEGIAMVKGMLKGTPEDREVYISLSQIYSRLKQWPDAESALEQAYKLSPKDEDKQYVEFLQGACYERQKKYEQAEVTFRKILAVDPQNGAVLNYFGYMLADKGEKVDEALIMIKKAVELEPANAAYLDSLGWAYFKEGKYDLAEDNLTKAAQRMGSDPTVQEHLGDLYQKTGRLKLAAAHWERSLDEWNKTTPQEQDTETVAKVQKKLESAKVKLAKEDPGNNK